MADLTDKQLLAKLRELVIHMHLADDNYGMAYYDQDEWRAAYKELRALVGMPPQDFKE